ncbi:hypothetical protein C8Q73DRAFT_446460 [Cubamyces lactineus]|nr:hypothetical protein C8Q73DRAFT_446460 [Cubamyces lactineus]
MPRLRTLDIAYVVASPDLRGLHHLRAWSCTWEDGFPGLIALLSRCPDLQTLDLSYFPGGSPDNVASTPVDPRISLLRLEKLYLSGLAFPVSAALGYIDAPRVQEVVLAPVYNGYQLLYSQIRSLFLPASPTHQVLPCISSAATVELRDGLHRYEMKCATAHQCFELEFSHGHGFEPQPTLAVILRDFVYLMGHWSSRFVYELRLTSGFTERVPHTVWKDVFIACEGLEILHCVVVYKGSLLDMWAGMMDAMSAFPPGKACCPYLWYIGIHWAQGISSVDNAESELQGMKLALQTRAERGARLEELRLLVRNDEHGLFTERALGELSPYVTEAHA